MTVIIIEKAPARLYGELTRWLIEPKHGVFIGNVSAIVRDKLWERVKASSINTNALLIHSDNSEQGFAMEMFGNPSKQIVDIEGVQLVKTL